MLDFLELNIKIIIQLVEENNKHIQFLALVIQINNIIITSVFRIVKFGK